MNSSLLAVERAVDVEAWPELVSFDKTTLPVLDLTLLPTWLGRFASELSGSLETPPELAGAMSIGIASSTCARRFVIEANDGHRETTNLWIVVALEPANLKSAVEKSCKEPLMAWERDKATELEPQILQARSDRKTIEARLKAIRAAAANPRAKVGDVQLWSREVTELEQQLPNVPSLPRLWTADATPERIATLLAENDESMLIASSEGGIFDVLAGRYSKGVPNLDVVLQSYSGDSSVTDRLSRDLVRLNSPCLSMALSPQPDVVAVLADQPGFAGRGLLGRIQWLKPSSPIGYRTFNGTPMTDQVRTGYHEGIRAMLDWPKPADGGRHVVTLSDEARDEWRAFRATIECAMRPGAKLEHFKAWAGKASGAVLRLAAVFHGVKNATGKPWNHPVTIETMQAALAVFGTIMPHSVATLSSMAVNAEQRAAIRVLDHLTSRQIHGCSIRDIHVALKHQLTRVAQVQAAIAILEERGYVRVIKLTAGPDGGRPPSPIVQLRPELLA